MKLYADLPGRRTVQLLSDVMMLCWIGVWAWVGRLVHDATMTLAAPGRGLVSAGSGFRDRMVGASQAVDDLPLIEDRLAEPFRSASGAGTDIEQAGQDLISSVTRLANILGWVTALIPIIIVGGVWFLLRARFARRASAAQRFIDDEADLDLFALRAMTRQPMRRIAAVSPEPGAAWRRGDRDVIRSLALLELRDVGLRPPG